jgi:rod shape-determining protein MreD
VLFLVWLGVVALAALIDISLLSRVDLGGGRPNLALVCAMAWGMLRDAREASIAGLVGGVVLDAVSASPIGVHSIALTSIAASVALAHDPLHNEGPAFFVLTGILATVAYHAVLVAALLVGGHEAPGLTVLSRAMVPAAAMNAALLIPIFVFVRRVDRVLSGWRQLDVE